MPDPTPNPSTSGTGSEGGTSTPPAPGATGAGARGADHPSHASGHGSPASDDRNPRRAAARDYIGKYGATRAVMTLMADNHALRETRREVPPGAIVLTGEDATTYAAFRDLKLKPEQITSALKERDDLKTWKGTRERSDQIGQMAEKVGYKATVLTTLLAPKLAEGARLELRDVTVERNGKQETESVPHLVTGTGDTTKAERLTAVVERDFKDFLPALTASTTSTTSGTGNGSAAHGATGSPRYPAQRETSAKGGDATDPLAHLTAQRVRPSQIREMTDKKLGRTSAA